MVAASERAEVTAREGLARVLQRARGKRRCQEVVGHLDTTSSVRRVPCRNGAFESHDDRLEGASFNLFYINGDSPCGHTAAEIAAQSTRNDGALGGEDTPDCNPLRDVRVGHPGDELDHIGQRGPSIVIGWLHDAVEHEPGRERVSSRRLPRVVLAKTASSFEGPLRQPRIGKRRCAQDEVHFRVPVIHRQHDGHHSHIGKVWIGNIIAEERLELLENKALHTQVPVTGTLFVSSHGTRLQGGSDAAKQNFTLRSLAVA
jgi:hypothetical protein